RARGVALRRRRRRSGDPQRSVRPGVGRNDQGQTMNVVRFCRQNRRAVYLLTVALFVAGLVAAFRLPSNVYPELSFPRIVIVAHSGDLSPQNMLLNVTRPIEEAAKTVLGAQRVR